MSSRLPTAVVSVVAMEGAGKTRFWTTAPKPIVAVSTDTNTEATVRDTLKLSEDDVVLHQVSMPTLAFDDRDDVKEEAGEKWEAIRDALRPLVKSKADKPATVVFDTAIDVYDMRVLAEFGKLDQIPPEQRKNMMGRCNTSYKGIIQAFKDAGVHVILVHRAKEKWADRTVHTTSGLKDERYRMEGPFDMEREGFKGTGFITNVEVLLAFDRTRGRKEGLDPKAALAMKYGMQIARCNPRPMLIGEEYWGREKLEDGSRMHRVSFPFLMTQMYPRTTVEDWR